MKNDFIIAIKTIDKPTNEEVVLYMRENGYTFDCRDASRFDSKTDAEEEVEKAKKNWAKNLTFEVVEYDETIDRQEAKEREEEATRFKEKARLVSAVHIDNYDGLNSEFVCLGKTLKKEGYIKFGQNIDIYDDVSDATKFKNFEDATKAMNDMSGADFNKFTSLTITRIANTPVRIIVRGGTAFVVYHDFHIDLLDYTQVYHDNAIDQDIFERFGLKKVYDDCDTAVYGEYVK